MHEQWVRKYASTLETRLRYIPSDCFDTFPLPADTSGLEEIGEACHEHRRQVMFARQQGLTATYNRFHDPDERGADIARLRELHVALDQAVAAAYGWEELDLGHGFHQTKQGQRFTISEPAREEVLARLLRLNHERYDEEERAGPREKGKGGARRGSGGAGEASVLGEAAEPARPAREGQRGPAGAGGGGSGGETRAQPGLL